MKVSEMPYVRPNKEKVLADIKSFSEKIENASSKEDLISTLKDFCDYYDDFVTTTTLAYIRFTQNTADEFYAKEKDFSDEISPELKFYFTKMKEAIYNSKFRNDLEKEFTPVFFDRIKLQLEVNDERLIPLQVEENKLISTYTKLMSGLEVSFNGETVPPSEIVKYATNPDRELRKGAYFALGEKYLEHAEEIDDIFDKLVKVRTKEGKAIGDENFCKIGYANMNRTCYNKDDIAKFRANVKKYFVPLVKKIKERVKKEQGWDRITYYDNSIYVKEELNPIGTPEEIFDKGQKMYDELNADTSKLFRNMREIEAFDVLSRKGKWGGGYMTELPKYKTPFILANFNGSCGDIEVLTHEFGHSLNGAMNFKIPYHSLLELTMETAEVHSMSMEFLTYPWMPLFFGDRTDAFKFNHIASGISFIPYGTIVDCFQQKVYENPDMTPTERNELWKNLQSEFMPYMDNSKIPFYGDGRLWQRQAHIFELPFYYIDYCLAQFTAFQFLALASKNREEAVSKYMAFVKLGATRSFTELLELSGLKSPFEESSFVEITNTIEKILNV